MKFTTNVTQNIVNMWVNINEKHHYNEWHVHPFATLSGAYYIKHDGSAEGGDILFKHPIIYSIIIIKLLYLPFDGKYPDSTIVVVQIQYIIKKSWLYFYSSASTYWG